MQGAWLSFMLFTIHAARHKRCAHGAFARRLVASLPPRLPYKERVATIGGTNAALMAGLSTDNWPSISSVAPPRGR